MNDAEKDQALPAWIMNLTVGPDSASGLTEWLVKVMLAGVDSPGYVNAEILPPPVHESAHEWTLLLRFQRTDQIDAWQTAETLKNLIAEVAPRVEQGHLTLVEKTIEQYSAPTNVATAIVTHIKPGREADYRKWVGRIHVAQANAQGYRGTFLQPAQAGSKDPWTTLLRFDSTESLDRWFASDERKRLISDAEDLLRYDLVHMTSAFPGWFPTDPATGQDLKWWKTAMLVVLVLYPQLILKPILPAPFSSLPWALELFCSVSVTVSLISLVLMPIAVKVFKFWLFPTGHNPRAESIKGYILLFLLYAIEVGVGTWIHNLPGVK